MVSRSEPSRARPPRDERALPGGEQAIAAPMSRAEAVARNLETAISDGTIPAGSRLGTKDDLRRRFGVAAGTLNEAIRLLQIRGLVEARPGPGGGLFASSPSPAARLAQLVLGFREQGATASDCLVVRAALEPLVATDAAEHADADDVAELRAILDRMAPLVGDVPAFLRAAWDLHRRVARISPNAVLASAYVTVLDFAQDRLELHAVAPDETVARAAEASLAVYAELVDAVAAGDGGRAAAAARQPDPLADLAAARLAA
jgi:DNA-binding FadR family transcriptional regulator